MLKPHILAVDDTPENLQLLMEMLEEQGYDVRLAPDGALALRFAQTTPPDLILLDIKMPAMDGYEVCKHLKADERTRAIPVIFLSAIDDIVDKVTAFRIGGVDYITKPFQLEEVLARVRTHLTIQQLQHTLHRQNQELDAKNQVLHATLERERVILDDLRQSLSFSLPHELRTPLTAILGLSELLLPPNALPAPAVIEDYVQSIKQSGERLHRLVENNLLYAQLHAVSYASYPRCDPERQQTVEIALFLTRLAKRSAAAANRQADLSIVAEHAMLHVEVRHLEKILRETLDNAFKFSTPGTLVEVTTTVAEAQCVIMIRDHGRGMTQTQLDTIGAYVQFERRRYEQQGLGLGLVLATLLAQLEGGACAIESVVNTGTMIRLTFPCQHAVNPAVTIEKPPLPPDLNTLIMPPPAELEILYEHAVCGDVTGIAEELRRFARMDTCYAPFIEIVRCCAEEYEFEKVRQLIEQHRQQQVQ